LGYVINFPSEQYHPPELVFAKTQCQVKKHQVRGLQNQKKWSAPIFIAKWHYQMANEHFSDERNVEIGVFLLTQIKFSKITFFRRTAYLVSC